jgi:hypothetical protein
MSDRIERRVELPASIERAWQAVTYPDWLALIGSCSIPALLHIIESRPMDVLDLVGIPLPGHGGATYGPALVAA